MGRNRMPWKGIVDSAMFLLLLNQMAYALTGQRFHEWTGAAMVFLILCHNYLNRRWFGAVRKGKYHFRRLLGTVLNGLLLTLVCGLLISGVVMSRYVFAFLPIHGGRAIARRVHLFCDYWGFLLMAVHMGIHWNGIKGRIDNLFGKETLTAKKKRILSTVEWTISVYGIYAFYRHEIFSFLLLRNEFAIFNQQAAFLFIFDYLAMIVLVVKVTSYFTRIKRKEHMT